MLLWGLACLRPLMQPPSLADTTLWMWGANSHGQLGIGSDTDNPRPGPPLRPSPVSDRNKPLPRKKSTMYYSGAWARDQGYIHQCGGETAVVSAVFFFGALQTPSETSLLGVHWLFNLSAWPQRVASSHPPTGAGSQFRPRSSVSKPKLYPQNTDALPACHCFSSGSPASIPNPSAPASPL